MLGEIIDLVKFAVEFISDRQAKSGGWSTVYLLYVSLGVMRRGRHNRLGESQTV